MQKRVVNALIVGGLTALCAFSGSAAEPTWEYTVQVSAAVDAAQPKVVLSWPQDTLITPSSYTVYRKSLDSGNWGAGTTLPGTTTTFTDTSVQVGGVYEYAIAKATATHNGYGYICVGVNTHLMDTRGKVVLVVDGSQMGALSSELTRLQADLVGDGWQVVRHDVSRNDSAINVKNLIRSTYQADPANVKAVFLFGHVPVPYSGNIVPDGHYPEHQGAWPADAYYGDMDGSWTDNSVYNTGGSSPRTHNVPGDGKFDQSTMPSAIELQVGRVDLANMPGRKVWGGPATFPTETELLRQYLNKDHNFRHKRIAPPRRALVHDSFGARGGEAFAASAYRSYAPLLGPGNITSIEKGLFMSTLGGNHYLMAYGCGGGSYSSIVNLGNTGPYMEGTSIDVVEYDIKAVFTMLMGSWLGDWDSEDNIMRAVLATRSMGLACSWSGRPHWFYHHLGIGETLGYSARLTQNNGNGGLYKHQVNNSAGGIHVGLMGDPTLRLHPVAPAANLTVASSGNGANLTWTASPEAQSYHVYRAAAASGPFTRVTSSAVTSTSYTDANASGATTYMVRAVKLENTTSGSYYNASQGIFATVDGAGSGDGGGGGGNGDGGGTTNVNLTVEINLTAPPNNATVSGPAVTLSATVVGSPLGVQFMADGENIGPLLTAPPYQVSWDSTKAENKGYQLNVVALLPFNNAHWSDPVWVNVANTSGGGGATNGTTTTWVDEALPAGALANATGGDVWNWVNVNPTPVVGAKAHQSVASSGLHQHFFDWASQTLTVGAGETLFAHVYLDPASPPREIMLQWNDGSWEHRAYWGENLISYGTANTATRKHVGPLPAAGQWVRLEVPASAVALEGRTVRGMAFTLFDGRATWDAAGKFSGSFPENPNPNPGGGSTNTNTPPVTNTNSVPTGRVDRPWFDDQLPAGVRAAGDGGDSWTWGNANPAAYSGAAAHYSTPSSGFRQHFFNGATEPMSVGAGDVLYTYVYLDAANPPSELMLQWNDGTWDHRAYWGADQVLYGVKDTESRKLMGALPALGQWVRLEVPAIAVGLEGKAVRGMAFTLYGGRAAFDVTGVNTLGSSTNSTGGGGSSTTNPPSTNSLLWVDDRLPTGGVGAADGGDGWNWVTANPAPFTGAAAHQSSAGFGLHQHYFDWATQVMDVGVGETLYAYVYLDPANPPSQIMLQWNTGGDWAHRAYWGANRIQYGFENTPSRRNMGALPAAGQWVRLEVPAASVGLDGKSVRGMAFSLFDGRATWDAAGKGSIPQTGNNPGTAPSGLPVVSVSASGPNATEQGSAAGEFTFTRTGPGSEAVTVKFALSGSAGVSSDYSDVPQTVTITAGAAAATLAIQPIEDSLTESLETVVITLSEDAAYAIGANKQATVTIADNDAGSGGSNTNTPPGTNAGPEISSSEYVGLRLPKIGDHTLHVLSPDLLELQLITRKDPDPAPLAQWNFVGGNNQFIPPALAEFSVTVNGAAVPVQAVGFKRRALWAPIAVRDLRVLNCLYLKIGTSVSDSQQVEVKNPSGALWNATTTKFQTTVAPLRYSPAIHVNQEGYVPEFPKKAMVGYFIGSFGEMDVPAAAGFKLVDAGSGADVFQGTLKVRTDVGFPYSPAHYQKVYEADFSAFKQPGEYRLVVPGLGASLPFLIDDGIAMNFARTYALGLYHQRCGDENKLPFTRHEHEKCHLANAEVPLPSSSFPFTWNCIAGKTVDAKENPRHTAVRLMSEATQLYPMVNRGNLDVSGGHHDAGDYSKYTANSAALTHYLMFAVDSLPGVDALDNLGLPNSGDGISDVLQEAKWEADYLAKIQDADGGFYFLVYPKEREYEWGVTPDHGDPQVVWPKNTAVTAAAVAALAQTASSPKFKQLFPNESAKYLQKAKLGWQFLMNAIAKYGKDGAYQKLTHYGQEFLHDDELAWAACEMFLATGDEQYHAKLKEWFDPSNPATFRWGWWRLYEAWGAAIRSYAFAARSGRLPASQLDAAYLAKCEEQVVLCAQEHVTRSKQSAYGTSFPIETKAMRGAGWYFSSERAFDIAVGYQLQPKPEFIEAIVANMNYEGGCNPVNVAFVTGLGWKRQRDAVHQFALADHRSVPPTGIPIGGFTTTSQYSEVYKGELRAMDYPDDEGGMIAYPLYDRWSDSWNVVAEFVHLDQARSLASLAFLATLTPVKDQPWKSATARIIAPAQLEIGKPNTVSVQVEGKNLDGARIVWEARDSEPGFGREFVVTPKTTGDHWIETEIQWPDGTRAFARHGVEADGSLVVWMDDEVPAGAAVNASGGDSWKWVNNPAPQSGDLAHESSVAAGMHQHWFAGATSTLKVNPGDTLFVYVYLDPANPPSEIMLQWNADHSEHRAYWGANQISLGGDATASRYYVGALPPAGQWVKLEVPASAVGLEGRTLHGMAFTLFNGRAWWDSAGRSAQ